MMPEVSKLELLGDELSRRGLRTTLAPQEDGLPALDVIRVQPPFRRCQRVTWSGDSFTWPWGEQIAADIAVAADRIADALSWHVFLQNIGIFAG